MVERKKKKMITKKRNSLLLSTISLTLLCVGALGFGYKGISNKPGVVNPQIFEAVLSKNGNVGLLTKHEDIKSSTPRQVYQTTIREYLSNVLLQFDRDKLTIERFRVGKTGQEVAWADLEGTSSDRLLDVVYDVSYAQQSLLNLKASIW
jgi:hypothetical protein